MQNGKWKMKNLVKTLCAVFVLCGLISAQTENPPAPGAPKSVKIPAVQEKTLKNGLTVAVVERKNVPLVTVQLLVNSGASSEEPEQAGLASMTAELLTKGTKTRTATQIAEQIAFLGGSLNTNAGWNSSTVSVNVMSDKLDQALAIMSDAVLNPTFSQNELDLLKSQTLDGLTYNLTQPGFLTNYVASVYSYDEHPADGTLASINAISRNDIVAFHKDVYEPSKAVLIFTGDISATNANKLAEKYFGKWKDQKSENPSTDQIVNVMESPMVPPAVTTGVAVSKKPTVAKRILVIDLPNSGQASVSYTKSLYTGRVDYDDNDVVSVGADYYPSIVLNSLLGGGYSSRLNQEIRIKRGLSYGAGSSFAFREFNSNFGTRTQTKNESAAEVAELVVAEIKRLKEGEIPAPELDPRKLVLTGSFGRSLETTNGLANALADLYSFGLPASNLNTYMTSVQNVSDKQIKEFAGNNLYGGDIIIVGDYAKFKDDLAKRFPGMKVTVIPADELDITKENLRK